MNEECLIISKVKDALIQASSSFRPDKKEAYKNALKNEKNDSARWVLENLIRNSLAAEKNYSPLCDDTGVPHLFLEFGGKRKITVELIELINIGVAEGLRALPGRPMALNGNDIERLEQSGGLNEDPGVLIPAPLIIKPVQEDIIRLHILLQGGGPEIRGKTDRVFHKKSYYEIIDQVVNWIIEEAGKLGCTPCTPAIGIGRSHYEATVLMIEAMVQGNFSIQSEVEKEITRRVNDSNIGPLGMGGNTTALATFLKVGPQRASGVRIVCYRLCCCMEPRIVSVLL